MELLGDVPPYSMASSEEYDEFIERLFIISLSEMDSEFGELSSSL
jgi:hypothetical protein